MLLYLGYHSDILWLHQLNGNGVEWIRVLFYEDNLISSQEIATLRKVLEHLQTLGFTINWQKSTPLPILSLIYLGVEFNASTIRAELYPARLDVLNSVLSATRLLV